MLKKSLIALAISAVFGMSTANAERGTDVTPEEAFEIASKDSNVYILDVRTGDEWKMVGHPGPNGLANSNGEGKAYRNGADLVGKVYNLSFWLSDPYGGWIWGSSKEYPQSDFDTDLMSENYPFVQGTDTLLILCRTGGRAALAADYLGGATGPFNFKTHRILNGFVGFPNDKTYPGPDTNYRDVNGWVNDKLPYNDSSVGAYYPPRP